jgi:hypothetical protein
VDESLSFLDAYVEAAVARGAPRYSPPAEPQDDCAFVGVSVRACVYIHACVRGEGKDVLVLFFLRDSLD